MVASRRQRATWLPAVGTVLVVTALVFAAPVFAVRPAAADPVGDLQTQARAIAEKLDALQHQAEVASERVNGAQYRLSQLKMQIATARTRADQARGVAALNSQLLSRWAVRAYVNQDGDEGVSQVFDGNSDELATRFGYRRAVLGDRQQLIDDLDASQVDAADAVNALQRDESSAKAAAEQAQTERARLVTLADQAQRLQATVQGQLVEAVAAQQAAIEARAQQQAAAASGQLAADAQGGSPSGPAATPPGVPPSRPPATAPGAPKGTRPTAPPITAAPKPLPAPGPAPPVASGAATAVAAAKSQVGKPYIWGGASPSTGFDCSGLTSWAWARAGVSIPHFAQAQYDGSRRISASALQPGDLVFYADSTGYVYHVAMYIGGGQVVQALDEKYGVMIGSLYSVGSPPYAYGRV